MGWDGAAGGARASPTCQAPSRGGAGQPEGLFSQVAKSCAKTRGWSSSWGGSRGSRAAAPSTLPAPPCRRAASAQPGAAPERVAAAGALMGRVRAQAPRAPRLLLLPAQPSCMLQDQQHPGVGSPPLSAPQDRGWGRPGAPRVPQRAMQRWRLAAVPAGQVFGQTPALLEASTSWSAASTEQIPDTWGLCNGSKGEPGQASSL